MHRPYTVFIGIDWGRSEHYVCAVDLDGRVLHERKVENDALDLRQLADWAAALAPCGLVAAAIELPHGAIIDCLLEREIPVFSINPKQVDRFRDRYSPAGAKDDRRDAFVLADSLRTDTHCFRIVEASEPAVIHLRELVRMSEELRTESNRLGNRLREQLSRYFPELLRVSGGGDEPWVLELLQKAPTRMKASRLRSRTIANLLKKHRIRRLDADEVTAALQAPPLPLAPGTERAATAHIALLIPRIRLVQAQQRATAREVDQVLQSLAERPLDERDGQFSDVEILLSLPGVGRTVAATMLTAATRPIKARDYHALRALSGVAPITVASGKSRQVRMRRACDRELRDAMYHFGRVAVQVDTAARRQYAALRARGHSHGRALRSVTDRMLRILTSMLRSRTLYDPARLKPVPPAVAA
jgi:transposase